jgi:hypothetical protein
MVDEAIQKRDRIAATYLHQLQALAAEVAASMDAIAGNALSKFQESVARQEMLCACLTQMANSVSEGFRTPEKPSHACIDPALEGKIRAASGTLRELNLQYAALLRHSGRSIALLSALCRCHTGQFQEAHGPRPKYQTWSCEM